ncbi:hypothetical protein Ctob_016416 [Chrysochromulina tobinii]|uniref:Uncharacterized protein n=1 Tax=Chrysochromulina tobinii TaxID=1460289 RepID=A0A0M0K416_9EUKA|nr:hypothetical protein Ctob_016416 [Chrysochromulina tobinii]|eukprot:KOO33611.1 hypothetical protein Ctob_016416 [Chrysochromulina sp. CCMP291]
MMTTIPMCARILQMASSSARRSPLVSCRTSPSLHALSISLMALWQSDRIRILFALTASAPSALLVSRYTRSSARNTAYISASMTSHVAGSRPPSIPRPVARSSIPGSACSILSPSSSYAPCSRSRAPDQIPNAVLPSRCFEPSVANRLAPVHSSHSLYEVCTSLFRRASSSISFISLVFRMCVAFSHVSSYPPSHLIRYSHPPKHSGAFLAASTSLIAHVPSPQFSSASPSFPSRLVSCAGGLPSAALIVALTFCRCSYSCFAFCALPLNPHSPRI